MFPRTSRIPKADVAKVIEGGISYYSPSFSLKVIKNSLNKALFTTIISKKVAKTAVLRNKNKRRVREAVKRTNNLKEGRSYALFIKKNTSGAAFQELCSEIKTLLAEVR